MTLPLGSRLQPAANPGRDNLIVSWFVHAQASLPPDTGTEDPTGGPQKEHQVTGFVYYVHVLYLGKSDTSMQQKT